MMPEECPGPTNNDLERLLDEDYTLNADNLQTLLNSLESEDYVTTTVAEKLLSLFNKDVMHDDNLKFATNVVKIVATLLKKIGSSKNTTLPDLVPSALAVINILKKNADNTLETLKTLCFNTLICYPDETLITLCVDHSNEIFELVQLYCHQLIPDKIRVEPLNLLTKLLKILPSDKKLIFVKDGINVWFLVALKLIPLVATTSNIVPNLLEALELLTDQLMLFDYMDNGDWLQILENIYTPERYPSLLKGLLEGGNSHWHRLWIIFIKLLKSQITKTANNHQSIINALLPCLEKAFKMQITDRCRALECWNVLIESFSKDTNEALLNKRLKLLMIPLTSNNAKVEELALAKFDTWWNLITRFQTKLDKFSEMVVIPFLSYCLGKPTSNASEFIPGKISEKTKVQCVQAFINMVGHAKCEGCVALPKLGVKLLNPKLLVSHWKGWIHSLSSAIRTCVEQDAFSDKQIQCVWTSFIITIAELPDSNIRRDLFNETLIMLEGLTQEHDHRLLHVIVNVLIPSLFDAEGQIQALLNSDDEQNSPFHKIVAVLNKLQLECIKDRKTAKTNIKMLTDWAVDDTLQTSSSVKLEWFVKTLSPNGVLLWTALAESIVYRVYTECPRMIAKMFLWPFNCINNFITKDESTTAWFDLYKTLYPYLPIGPINKEIVKALITHNDNQSSRLFVLKAAITVLEQKQRLDEDTDLDKDLIMILDLTISKISDAQLKSILPSLAGVIIQVLTGLNKNTNMIIAERVIVIINNILRVFNTLYEQLDGDVSGLVKCIENIFNALESTFQVELYSKLKDILVDQLKACAPNLKHENSLNGHILAIYKKSLNEIVDDSNANQIEIQKTDPVNFNTPRANVAKKSSKKASIINTIVENGEEFAVIKPNYKFNPRKLTDKQKEKLQRKREDIPALYQDLSQSQDEFKLTTWKIDSQDTSTTTSSKSTNMASNDGMSEILKNSDFLPKIVENIVIKPATDLRPEIREQNSKDSNEKSEKNNIKNVHTKFNKERMKLKERIFRNKRNLIENYQENDSNVNFSNTEDTHSIQKTKSVSNLTKSAPSQMNTKRPSRVKRKPKKFDEVQLIPLSKKRHTLNPGLDVEMTTNQNEMTLIFSDGEETCIGNKDKVMNDVDNQDFIDIASTAMINDNTNTLEQDEKDKLVKKTTMTPDDSVAVQTLPSKKTVGLKTQKETKGNASVDAKNTVSSTATLIHPNEIKQMANLDNINNIQQNHSKNKLEDKIEENISVEITEHFNSDETSNTVTTREKLCQDNSEIDITSKYGEKTKNMEETVCASDTSTNTSDVDEVIGQPKHSHKISRPKKYRSQLDRLAIDMVERHLRVQSEKRSTKKEIVNSPSNQRKRLSFNLDYSKLERKAATLAKNKIKDKRKGKSILIKDTPNTEDISVSQDFIESSQDSDVTSISVKPSKPIAKKKPIVLLDCIDLSAEVKSQNLRVDMDSIHMKDNSDIELTCNKTNLNNLTEEMDTQPIEYNAVIDLCVDEDPPTTNFEDITHDPTLEQDTENLAEADTQPVDPDMFLETANTHKTSDADTHIIGLTETDKINEDRVELIVIVENNENASDMETAEDITKTLSHLSFSALVNAEKEDLSSSCNNEQRKKDFIDDTLQISPIKSMSPIRDQKSPSPETSSDYDLIKFASPVQSNGEPFETCESPEIFTEDKVSPDKRDQSPPRAEICVKNSSPSSSLSLKKNRPQMRAGGRAAQMLGMCVSDTQQTMVSSEKPTEVEEDRNPSLNSTARRNLRTLYNSSSNDNWVDTEESENFLKFKKSLPSTDCSPAGPILKRKLIDITDESTASPASKRKRVSFHDPPVSTTICVKKYIEPMGVRSPQNSAYKRLERQSRALVAVKSPKRLDNVFKLDTVLTKAIESFSEANETQNMTEDTELSSLDETPVVEVVKTSDLNDTDPICNELVDCEDHIENIAAELSSPAMKALLVQKFEGKVETIGDLAKMTELEVNRLCIKAPKIQVAKKVLNEYLLKLKRASEEITPTIEAALSETTEIETKTSVEVQTVLTPVHSIEMQTECVAVSIAGSQTDSVLTSHTLVQTEESGSKSTAEIIAELTKMPDFNQIFADELSFDTILKIVMDKISKSDGTHVSSILELIRFCTTSLEKIIDKPA